MQRLPDAEPRVEPLRPGGPNKPYEALGSSYTPVTADTAMHDAGGASWYGAKFHGQRTASGEPYDLFAMTAAHRTMPIPSFARVRNPANGREVIVRINDRGPFVPGRVIDLSYTAALKLGVLGGVAPVVVERLTNDEIRAGLWRRDRLLAPPERLPAGDEPLLASAAADPLGALAAALPGMAQPAAPAARVAASATSATSATATTLVTSAPSATPALHATPIPMWTAATSTASAAATPTAQPVIAAIRASAADADTPPRAPGFWLQIGAFRLRDGAAQLQQRLQHDGAWLAPLRAVFDAHASLFRLQAGPYASRAEALAAAARLRTSRALTPLLLDLR